jgi:phage terminase Nu1 subunit (DNA packaging protein)
MKFVSFAEYARHRGISRVAVSKAIKDGRISSEVGPNGKKGVFVEKANSQWAANTKKFAKAQVEAVVDEVAKEVEQVVFNAGLDSDSLSYNDVRIRKEKIQADLLQLKLDELSGDLVPAKDIEKEWANIATKVKTKVLGISSKMKQRYANLSIEQYDYLDQLSREALEEISNESD